MAEDYGDVIIPDGVKTIVARPWAGRANKAIAAMVTSITVNDSCTEIGYNMTEGCENLEWVYIPSSVTQIDHGLLDGNPDAVIKCEAGSYAEQYAKDNGLKYEIQ